MSPAPGPSVQRQPEVVASTAPPTPPVQLSSPSLVNQTEVTFSSSPNQRTAPERAWVGESAGEIAAEHGQVSQEGRISSMEEAEREIEQAAAVDAALMLLASNDNPQLVRNSAAGELNTGSTAATESSKHRTTGKVVGYCWGGQSSQVFVARALPSKTCSTTSLSPCQHRFTSTHLLLPLAARRATPCASRSVSLCGSIRSGHHWGSARRASAARTGRYVYEVPSAVQAQLRSSGCAL